MNTLTLWSLTSDCDAGLYTTLHTTVEDAWRKLAYVWFPLHQPEDADDVSGDKENYDRMLAVLDTAGAAAAETWFDEWQESASDDGRWYITPHYVGLEVRS